MAHIGSLVTLALVECSFRLFFLFLCSLRCLHPFLGRGDEAGDLVEKRCGWGAAVREISVGVSGESIVMAEPHAGHQEGEGVLPLFAQVFVCKVEVDKFLPVCITGGREGKGVVHLVHTE